MTTTKKRGAAAAPRKARHPLFTAEKKTPRSIGNCERFVLLGSDESITLCESWPTADRHRGSICFTDGSVVAEPVYLRNDVAEQYAIAWVAAERARILAIVGEVMTARRVVTHADEQALLEDIRAVVTARRAMIRADERALLKDIRAAVKAKVGS